MCTTTPDDSDLDELLLDAVSDDGRTWASRNDPFPISDGRPVVSDGTALPKPQQVRSEHLINFADAALRRSISILASRSDTKIKILDSLSFRTLSEVAPALWDLKAFQVQSLQIDRCTRS